MRRHRLWLLAAMLLPLAFAGLASCSDPPSSAPTPDAGARRDSGTKPTDAGPDVEVPVHTTPVLPSCLGDELALKRAGEKSYVAVPMSAGADAGADAAQVQSVGDFLLDFGSNGSSIDLAGGFKTTTPPTPLSCNGNPALPGASCAFPYFDFFGTWGTVYLSTADYGVLVSSLRQSGIVGTDFLSAYPFTLDYVGKRVFRGSAKAFCTDPQLISSGFVPVPTAGFYVNDTNKLRPLSDVLTADDAGATKNFVVPNIPTVPVSVAGVKALAQLDSGFDDRLVRHSLNVNKALLALIQQQDPTLLERAPGEDLYLTTCVSGISQKAEAWTMRPGTAVDFLGDGAIVARHDLGNIVFVKETLPQVAVCGGIDTWTVPAAQIGASFLVDALAVVFDPFTSRVWMPK